MWGFLMLIHKWNKTFLFILSLSSIVHTLQSLTPRQEGIIERLFANSTLIIAYEKHPTQASCYKVKVPKAQLKHEILLCFDKDAAYEGGGGMYMFNFVKAPYLDSCTLDTFKWVENHNHKIMIWLDNGESFDWILAHELGHAQQWEEKILKPYNEGNLEQCKKGSKLGNLRDNYKDKHYCRRCEKDADLRAARMLGSAYAGIKLFSCYSAYDMRLINGILASGWILLSNPCLILGTKRLLDSKDPDTSMVGVVVGYMSLMNFILSLENINKPWLSIKESLLRIHPYNFERVLYLKAWEWKNHKKSHFKNKLANLYLRFTKTSF